MPSARASELQRVADKLGFERARHTGSHERWRHPLLNKAMTIPGKNGDDVPLYLEKQLIQLLIELNTLKEEDS